MKINKAYYIILFLAGTFACNELAEPDSAVLGYDFFPLNTGNTRIYEVTRIDHSVGGTSDTINYQLKEVVGDLFTSGGEVSYRLERFIRNSAEEEWQIDSVWSARMNTYQAVVVENNIPVIKLSFPVKEDRRWDGNAMNARDYDEFKMIDVGLPYQLEDKTFASTLKMVKEDAATGIVTDNIHIEFYARGVGLIHRIDIDRRYCDEVECPASGIEFGLEIECKLIDYQLVE